MPKRSKWPGYLESLDMFSDDFMSDDRKQEIQQERNNL